MTTIAFEVSVAEHESNSVQFNTLNPVLGKIDGGTARSLFLKSQLPGHVLAQIWALADTDQDGMLDSREFSIAMRLIRNCLAGAPLPPTLPPSLLNIPASVSLSSTIPPGAYGNPMHHPCSPPHMAVSSPLPQSSVLSGSSSYPSSTGRQLANWAIPHPIKLKYSQSFNQLDKQRVGWLAGPAARNALGLSGLPTPLLAHIWSLSDVDKDGKLCVDEFCIAMYMIDMHKAGFALPDSTPPELVQMCGLSRSANNSPQLEPGAPPAQKSPALRTFEDKRMDNFAKGQAELERRRQILLDEENRRRAEVEKREREEFERRERERLEKERLREMERQVELERMRVLEAARLEEEKRRLAELEVAKREADMQRAIEADKMKVQEMEKQKLQETEHTAQRQQRQKTLRFQLQALDEKQSDKELELTKARQTIADITREIEGMREVRDQKMKRIAELQTDNQNISVQAQELAHQLLQLQGANKDVSMRKSAIEDITNRRDSARSNVDQMKQQLAVLKDRLQIQQESENQLFGRCSSTKSEMEEERRLYRAVLSSLNDLQVECQSKIPIEPIIEPSPTVQPKLTASPSIGASSGHLPSVSKGGATKYRAVFEFEARSADELSFQPGDVILVFEGHVSEPGWRAGQINDKVGWFPEAFAEPIGSVASSISQPIQNMPPNVTPSPSLDRIPEETVLKQSTSPPSEAADIVICQCTAQFPWKARNDGDLSFAKGDIIDVLQQLEMKWKGRKSDGAIGWFPKSYVKIHTKVSSTSTPPSTPVAIQTREIRNAVTVAPERPSIHNSPAKSVVETTGEWFTAIYDFEAAESNDLPLNVGDEILVIERNESWWKGRCNGREGIFPANYVVLSEKHRSQSASDPSSSSSIGRVRVIVDFEAHAINQLTIRTGDEINVREKSAAGWWEGELLRDGVTLSGWFPGDYAVPIEDSVSTSSGQITAIALFDYIAAHPDELSFSVGDTIIVDKQEDSEWWSGYKASASSIRGLFPSNYVQISAPPEIYSTVPALYEFPPAQNYQVALYDEPPELQPPSQKFQQLAQELFDTEERFLGDLVLSKKLFYKNLQPHVDICLLQQVFLNWDQLIETSKKIRTRLKSGQSIGSTFMAEIDNLGGFVVFCRSQQHAMDSIEKLLEPKEARMVYTRCCANPAARGMSLHYFLLLPLGRVTRYPLVFEKLLKECQHSSDEHQELDVCLQLLRSLVNEVNRAVTEVDSLAMLFWAQTHIKQPNNQPSIEFTSLTNKIGNRLFIHSGLLYKQRSGRMLLGFLFNDLLLLATPDETIDKPDVFKVSKELDMKLSLYRVPMIVAIMKLELNKENENNFQIIMSDGTELAIRCQSRNALKMWTTQLQQTIDNYTIAVAELNNKQKRQPNEDNPKGRLMVELVSTNIYGGPVIIHFNLGNKSKSFEVQDGQAKADMQITTQFSFTDVKTPFSISFFKKCIFQPNIPIDKITYLLRDLIMENDSHRGPLLKQVKLRRDGATRNNETAVIKFAVQIYDGTFN